jgi:hypothetical protein
VLVFFSTDCTDNVSQMGTDGFLWMVGVLGRGWRGFEDTRILFFPPMVGFFHRWTQMVFHRWTQMFFRDGHR